MPIGKFLRLFGMYSKVKRSRDIPEVTNFLANNEQFKKAAMGLHEKKQSFWKDLDSYLEKELVTKEETLGISEGKNPKQWNKKDQTNK